MRMNFDNKASVMMIAMFASFIVMVALCFTYMMPNRHHKASHSYLQEDGTWVQGDTIWELGRQRTQSEPKPFKSPVEQ